MPIISPFQHHPLSDGRQSDAALMVRRGVQRLCLDLNITVLPEVSLKSGRRADLIGLTRKGEIWIIEIKSSVEDWKADQKWPDYRNFCDRLFFATHAQVPHDIFPEDCGFILSDGYGGEILRDAPEHKLAPATRKALTLQLARIGANRLTLAEIAGVSIEHSDAD
ncbi:MAG: MmcB family DNA repair protein [Brucellaceae bacterium]|jgi:hypothetical protein|nr:MmcB family DNA repair protein [Brucellaceae bacterium]